MGSIHLVPKRNRCVGNIFAEGPKKALCVCNSALKYKDAQNPDIWAKYTSIYGLNNGEVSKIVKKMNDIRVIPVTRFTESPPCVPDDAESCCVI